MTNKSQAHIDKDHQLVFDNLNILEASKRVRGLSMQSGFSYAVTPNMDHLARICDAPEDDLMRQAYGRASLVLCDSRIVEKLLRLMGRPLKATIPGSDLTEYMFNNTLTPEDKVVVFGCKASTVDTVKEIYPHLAESIYHIEPSMGFIHKPDEVDALAKEMKEQNPDYVFICVGSPQQEVFAERLVKEDLERGVGLCAGAGINLLAGIESRAPRWIQRLNLEWFYRMMQDPKRLWSRYAMNAMYLPKVFFYLKKAADRRSVDELPPLSVAATAHLVKAKS